MATSRNDRVFVAGHRGMVGSAIVRELRSRGYSNFVTRSREQLDLAEQDKVRSFFATERIDQVYMAAAKVGGIHANNTYPAEFIYDNLMVQANIVHQAWRAGVRKLLFLGSSCIYPRLASQPMEENALLTGPLEPTNEPYAIAKIAGIKLCESYNRQYGVDYRSVMPTNLYGPGDTYDRDNSHVIPAMIRRFHQAKESKADEVVIWGTGNPRREFLFVDDLARACAHIMELDAQTYASVTDPRLSHINVGTGEDLTIRELAHTIAKVIGYEGRIACDPTKPDGTPRKLLDVSQIKSLGWRPTIQLIDGLKIAYQDFINKVVMAK